MYDLVISVGFAYIGGVLVWAGLKCDDFHLKPLASRRRGRAVPKWLARPFIVAIGMAFIFFAADLIFG